ncbi:preprotein translocase subunit SecA [Candidatus Kaiserbacteria bacterium RIFCSPHIGHO2_01_FULL_51_33]|uniref:Protein translocase subunit SecA n=1 Tax=Candidatus Kaiserbacteria bacterium RIFCSPLOWO2_01_FULL_51_21 TaxID=1798508 RepID=A0A1F6EE71_9BACT|nr:MAG: preprotein translocase subunit SecA [Candidatus Kaiserbacteria bacterium RIFCSPHIGHO2_01_FULL_51_33]OGG71969.1 MAG: preprotein translocase subunit SecA [Candidatus Kaiserbacteria bacterium RIFCSPLOWO2_01_FULL_51_21]
MFFNSLFSEGKGTKVPKQYEEVVKNINEYEQKTQALSDEELREKTQVFRDKLAHGRTLEAILPEAFAVVREAARRSLGERHFDVQLMGGIVLHYGNITEMRTGEGKTLVATLPAYLNALPGKGVHVVTVNDYLSRRDGVWMGQIYSALGLSVGVINHEESYVYDSQHTTDNSPREGELDKTRDTLGSFKVVHEFLRPVSRRESYEADITYGTNNEFGFDYLRDNIEYNPKGLRQRGFHFAIVDEIDSILIDEARTPLIISAPTTESENLYALFTNVARELQHDIDYTVDEKHRTIILTDAGIEKTEKILGIGNLYTEKGIKYVHHLETAVRAKALFERDRHYVVRDGEVVIVDEFTGRLQPGRRWSEGLHQAIEAKEGVAVQKESRTFASITFQNYFRLYGKLAGMTGTALTSSEEFYKVYGLEVMAIPTNKPSKRHDHNDLIFQTEAGKFRAVARKVKELNAKGQPVLIGTVSIEKNELLGKFLTQEGIQHEMLNAKNHEREGEIIAQAGRKGRVTVATNMAGRGVDIKLGGNPATKEEHEGVKDLGGLFVLGTERHEARRIDNQLRGRSGRQGDPGDTQFFVSLEDTLMRVFASDTIKKMMGRFGIPEDEPIENSLITRSLESAQTKIEGFNFDARKLVLEYDMVLNHQRHTVYKRRRKVLLGEPSEFETLLDELVGDSEEARKAIAERRQQLGDTEFLSSARQLLLQTIDMLWVEHLEVMDYMRGSVNLRAYGQRDPLVEYRKEGLRLFKEMEESFIETVLRLLPNIGAEAFMREEKQLTEVHQQARFIGGSLESKSEERAPAKGGSASGGKVGRNDPCPCGSGKKYKKCGMLNTEEHQKNLAKK